MKNKTVMFLFLLAVVIDLIAYNRDYIPFGIAKYPPTLFFIFFNHNIEIRDAIYFLGEAIAWSLFILSFMIYSKNDFVLNLFASAYLGLCLNNVYDELLFNNLVAYPAEYHLLLFTIVLVIYKIYVHKYPDHRVGVLFYKLRDCMLLRLFTRISK